MNIEKTYYFKDIKLENFDQFVKVFKTASVEQGLTKEWIVDNYLGKPHYDELMKEDPEKYGELLDVWYKDYDKFNAVWDDVVTYTPKEVFAMENAETKYVLMELFDVEKVVNDLEAKLVDSQTITKTQRRTNIKGRDAHNKLDLNDLKIDDIELTDVTYEDTYELYKISKGVFGTNNDIFYVKCNDTSTGKVYYLWVRPDINGETSDAIEAIASTMVKEDGAHLTKEEYLEHIVTES